MVLHFDNNAGNGNDIIHVAPAQHEAENVEEGFFEFTLGIASLIIKLGLMTKLRENHEELHRLVIKTVEGHLEDWRNDILELEL